MHRSISFICICGHCVWAFGELSCPLFTSSAAQKEVHNSNRGNAIPSLLYHRKMNLLTIRLQLLLVGGLCLSLGGPLNINYSSIYGLPNASMSPCPRHFVIEFVCPPKWQLHVIRIGHECDDRCKSSGVLVLGKVNEWTSPRIKFTDVHGWGWDATTSGINSGYGRRQNLLFVPEVIKVSHGAVSLWVLDVPWRRALSLPNCPHLDTHIILHMYVWLATIEQEKETGGNEYWW